jgi:hypothetical protein
LVKAKAEAIAQQLGEGPHQRHRLPHQRLQSYHHDELATAASAAAAVVVH